MLGTLTSMHILMIHNLNNLTEMPSNTCVLTRVQQLVIQNCSLMDMPKTIETLMAMCRLVVTSDRSGYISSKEAQEAGQGAFTLPAKAAPAGECQY